MIEYHGDEFYGRDRSYAMFGDKFHHNRNSQDTDVAVVTQNGRYSPVAQRQFMAAPTYDAVAVSAVESRDLSASSRPQAPVQAPMQLIKYENISPQAGPNVHVVKAGETFYRISRENGISVEQLQSANKLKPDSVLSVGQRLVIPKSAGASAAQPAVVKNLAEVAMPSSSQFVRPVDGDIISAFGVKGKGRQNDGINIKAMAGTPVKSAADGVVVYVGNDLQGYGNMIIISHKDGWMTAYAHNADVTVKRNQKVRQGDVIAHVGASGGVKEPQLHFSARRDKQPVDPETLFDRQLASTPSI